MLTSGCQIVIIGCGDIGQRLARLWQARAQSVVALVRSAARARELAAQGLEVVRGDLDQPDSLHALASAIAPGALIYYLAPPPAEGETDPRVIHFIEALKRAPPVGQIVYLGTSGVYGDSDGAWVDELSPTRPQTARARRRLAAEQALQRAAEELGLGLTLLRVGGIYGPGRLPEARLRKGLPLLREAECGYSNRIHLVDLLQVCLACAERPAEGVRIFNVSDNQPGNMTAYFLAVADALAIPHPEQLSLAEAQQRLSPAMLSYLGESRRLDSRKLQRELGVRLQYPDLASGLRDLRA